MRDRPVILTVGMAGSGKTTFVQRVQSDLALTRHKPPYVVNLDPAVMDTTYEANLDIRDTIDYKQVMKDYSLGPNGAILTALNLFATKWDQVLELIGKNTEQYTLVDTPGQIEIFTWSASGAIISETCAQSFPTCMAYIVDAARCVESPVTFMSNMLYACSIMYKLRLPFILVINKTDLCDHAPIKEWLTDFYAFQEALSKKGSESYIGSLMQSMGLVLEEFYCNIRTVAVSSVTGDGIDDFLNAVDEAVTEYQITYLPEMEARIAAMRAKSADKDNKEIPQLQGLSIND
jgi:GTPase SAR1 family protein